MGEVSKRMPRLNSDGNRAVGGAPNRRAHRWNFTFLLMPIQGVIALLAIGMFTACTADLPEHRRDQSVMGGDLVPHSSDEAAGLARLVARKTETQGTSQVIQTTQCTASFITRRVLLTAAHCIKPGHEHEVVAMVNEDFGGLKVERIVVHPDYLRAQAAATSASQSGHDRGPGSKHWPDLAMLFLEVKNEATAQVLARVQPISVAQADTSFGGSFLVRAFGFGLASAMAEGSDGQLRVAEFRGYVYEPSLSYFRVAMTQRLGLCSGDSGGPALLRSSAGVWSLLGVLAYTETSTVGERETCDLSATYVNVGPYVNWMIAELNQ
ncbi:MAG TPA: trypsin-like serine protease [Pseudobdellovibrionaceae bacterium]|nr:trypsin-like serine protease [Pseudobdellovibrionaceae bacterium]